jgi:hypothetical protein
MGTRFRRIGQIRWVLPLTFVVAAILIAAAGWLLVRQSSTLSDAFRLDAAKAALTIATGLVLGGALKFVLDIHVDAREARHQATDRRTDQLAGLRNVHDRVESARLLIPAHRSATTYGDLMRDLIGAQVTLLDIRRALATEVTTGASQDLADGFSNMVGYLQALHEEYRRNFKDASDAERFDQELTDQDFRRVAAEQLHATLADGIDPPPGDADERVAITSPSMRAAAPSVQPRSSGRAWALLQDSDLFPVLHDFCAKGPAYQRYFLDPYHAVVRALLVDPIEPPSRIDHKAEDARFAQHTHATNQEIAAACAAGAAGAAGAGRDLSGLGRSPTRT